MKTLEEKYGNDSEAAKLSYHKVICHYAKVSLTKDEKAKNFHPGLKMFEDLSGWYAAQVHGQMFSGWTSTHKNIQLASLSDTHGVHAVVVGFIDNPQLPPENAVLAFVTNGIMSALTSEFCLPFSESAALAMRKMVNGIQDLR